MFSRREVVGTSPKPQLEDHSVSSVRDCYSVPSQLPSISEGSSTVSNLRTPHAVVTRTLLTDAALALTPSLDTFIDLINIFFHTDTAS